MTVVDMLGQLGQLLNDPDEERYAPFDKLVRLNAAQQEIMSSIPVRELANLAVYNHRLQANDTTEQSLPLDFYRELSAECIRSVESGRIWRLISPETTRSFPFAGSRFEPLVKRSEGRLISFGKPFDEDVYFDYYRLPVRMQVDGVAEGYIDSSGAIVPGGSGTVLGDDPVVYATDVWRGGNVNSELPETVHHLIVQRAYQSFLISDQEVKEVTAT